MAEGFHVADNVGGDQGYPFAAAGGHHVLKAHPLLRVQTGGGLVEEKHLRVPQQRLGNAGPAHHAPGEGFYPAVRPITQVHQIQHPVDLLLLLSLGQAFQSGQVFHHLEQGQLPEHTKALGQIAWTFPALDRSAV